MNKLTKTVSYGNDRVEEWSGYTLDQLEQCRLVNAVKCELLKEQMNVFYSNTASMLTGQPSGAAQGPYGSIFSQFMNYAGYGLKAYKYIKGIVQLYRSFKN